MEIKNKLEEKYRNKFHEIIAEGNIGENLKNNINEIFKDANKKEGIICTGSFLIMKEIIEFFNLKMNTISEI